MPDAGNCSWKGTAEPWEGKDKWGFTGRKRQVKLCWAGWTAQHPKLAWQRHPPVCGPGWAMSSLHCKN